MDRSASVETVGQRKSLPIARRFSHPDRAPRSEVEWTTTTAEILDQRTGKPVFRQEGVEFPAQFSPTAVNVVAQKYFYGPLGYPDRAPGDGGREHSFAQVVDRIADTLAAWSIQDGYFTPEDGQVFGDELKTLLFTQRAAFNSPVWFNVGLAQAYGVKGLDANYRWDATTGQVVPCEDSYVWPQASACFITKVEDSMESIMAEAATEARLFKFGSGVGFDLSTLRSSRERLTGGGRPSGPLSFFKVFDTIAGVVKSGGKTRRAARLQCLDTRHPDILEFIQSKVVEERKAQALIAQGYDADYNGAAYASIAFQNTNISIKASDAFMEAAASGDENLNWQTLAVTTGTDRNTQGEVMPAYNAGWLLDETAASAHVCGDPGMQFSSTIARWHTVPNHGPITASNPCCFVGDTLVDTSEGRIPIRVLAEMDVRGESLPYAYGFDTENGEPVLRKITRAWCSGTALDLVRVTTDRGLTFTCTPEHRFLTKAGEYVEAAQLTSGTRLRKIARAVNNRRGGRRYINRRIDTVWENRFVWEQIHGDIPDGMHIHHKNEDRTDDRLSNLEVVNRVEHITSHSTGASNGRYIQCDETLLVSTWEALESHYGSADAVRPTRWNRYIRANNLVGVIPLARYAAGDGRIRGMSWTEFSTWVDQRRCLTNDKVASVVPITASDPVDVYDIEVDGTHNFAITDANTLHSLVVSNSEYLHVDDSACNLASLNWLAFLNEDGSFDFDGFRHACRIILIAQEILVGRGSYPTAAIAANSHRLRPLGQGPANVGGLLMALGLGYGSQEGRNLAAALQAVQHLTCLDTSAEMAEVMGPFAAFEANRDPYWTVVTRHLVEATNAVVSGLIPGASAAINDLFERIRKRTAFRNSQVTVCAPTGCAVPETLALTDKGLVRLGNLGDVTGPKWQDTDFNVQTSDGPRHAEKFFINGVAPVVSVRTRCGYGFQATPNHQLRVIDAAGAWIWRRMDEIQPGDVVPMRLGGMIGDPLIVPLPELGPLDPRATPMHVPMCMCRDLAELLGAFMANGSAHDKGLRFSVLRHDTSLIQRIVDMVADLFGLRASVEVDRCAHDSEVVTVVVNSVPLRQWWERAGFVKLSRRGHSPGKGYSAHVPDAVLETNDPLTYAAFIRGVIDHDGTVANGLPEFMNKDRQFVSDTTVMALALGFPMRVRVTLGGFSEKPVYRAKLLNRTYAAAWMELVGFTETRKAEAVKIEARMSGSRDVVYLSDALLNRVCPVGHPARRAALAVRRRTGHGLTRDAARQLLRESGDAELRHAMCFYYDTVTETRVEDVPRPTFDLSVPENVTWIGGGFVSHNTIAFLMDCATTGVEPELGLVKYKNLAGGGSLKLVNPLVGRALRKLGYAADTIERIEAHIQEYDTIEPVDGRSSGLLDADLPVFDCAFPPKLGDLKRSLAWQDRVAMVAALQPFVSGGISVTFNMPEDATVEDVKQAYIAAWRAGIKCVSIYRDNCKGSQPLSTARPEADAQPTETSPPPASVRVKLPRTRPALTHHFEIGEHQGYFTVGLYEDGRPGELFITMSKEGSTLAGLADMVGILFSHALQHGVPLGPLCDKLRNTRFEPAGFTSDRHIRFASSLADYLARWLSMVFVPGTGPESGSTEIGQLVSRLTTATEPVSVAAPKQLDETPQRASDNPLCGNCGHLTSRVGRCHVCDICGTVVGTCGG